MVDISGKLSELFKDYTEIQHGVSELLCKTMLNKPILDESGAVIGSIINYDLCEDRWFGILYKNQVADVSKKFPNLKSKLYRCDGIVIR